MNFKKIMSMALSSVLALSLLAIPGTREARAAAALNEPEIIDVFDLMYDGGENHIHGSTIVELPDGELLVAWFQGSGEKDGDSTKLMGARLPAGETKWTPPFEMIDVPGFPDINPSLYLDSQDRLWLFWYPILANRFETSQPKYVYADKGTYEYKNGLKMAPKWNWQEIMYVNPAEDFTGESKWNGSAFTHKLKGSEMRFLKNVPPADQLDPKNYVEVIGQTSGEKRYIIDSFVVKMRNMINDSMAHIQSTNAFGDKTGEYVTRMQNEVLPQAIARATGADNNLREWNPIYMVIGWQTKNKAMEIDYDQSKRLLLPLYSDSLRISIMAYSDDRGQTWNYSDPIAGVGNIQAATVQKEDGTLRSYFRNIAPNGEMVYNESSDGGQTWSYTQVDQNLKHNAGFDIVKLSTGEWALPHTDSVGARNSLSVSISNDEGKTWTTRPIQVTDDPKDKIHYPAVIQAKDGTIYVSYSQAIDKGDMKNIRIAKFTDFTRTVEPVNVETYVGQAPVLPASVKVTYQGTSKEHAVTWEMIAPSQYASVGTFTVMGTIDGESLKAVAKVTVKARSGGGDNGNGSGGDNGSGGGTTPNPTPKPTTKPDQPIDPKPEQPNSSVKKFKDLEKYAWAQKAIETLASMAIIAGTSETTFDPGSDITRADFVTLLVRAFKLNADFTSNFEDVDPSAYYYEALGIAKQLGLAKGVDGKSFQPQQKISRQDMMVLIYKVFKMSDKNMKPGSWDDIRHFADASEVSGYALESVAALVKEGIIVGSGNQLHPLDHATRAETAVILFKLLGL